MSWIWTGSLVLSLVCAMVQGNGSALAASIFQGAQAGVILAVSMTGSLCLWAGVGKLLDVAGITDFLSKLLKPELHRLFPGTKTDPALARSISGNICANFLGLGNAATPMGIQAAKAMKQGDTATDELCRLVVLNTASIQLIPASVAANALLRTRALPCAEWGLCVASGSGNTAQSIPRHGTCPAGLQRHDTCSDSSRVCYFCLWLLPCTHQPATPATPGGLSFPLPTSCFKG